MSKFAWGASLALALLVPLTSCRTDVAVSETDPASATRPSFYTLSTRGLEGDDAPLARYEGNVALVVNVASACGLTPQYEGLEALHKEFAPRGFTVLAFPSNDFGGQEPGSPAEIRAFCDSRYGVTFPLFEKVQTKPGPGQSPVYAHLGAEAGALPGWNFGKYLIGRDGKVLRYFDPRTTPQDPALRGAIEQALAAGR
jgi:glutathione peroxidase